MSILDALNNPSSFNRWAKECGTIPASEPRAFYNEIDPYAAQWLRNLIAEGHIAPGDVDERSIVDIRPADLNGYTQCHFFAGIGGWSLAARLAGWPDSRPLWTGSCPCQPFSSASRGRRLGLNDSLHLWPVWAALIGAKRPHAVFGEQVSRAGDWLDEVCSDLEALGYETAAFVLPAYACGADHARERIYFTSYTDRDGEPRLPVNAEMAGLPGRDRQSAGVGSANGISARLAQLRAFGNAIVPQVAAEVLGAFLDAERARGGRGRANTSSASPSTTQPINARQWASEEVRV
jgi:DNA (cytosine-5)-methyltransferase 1